MWLIFKLMIKVLKCNESDYIKAVNADGITYVISISKYEGTENTIRQMKNALN